MIKKGYKKKLMKDIKVSLKEKKEKNQQYGRERNKNLPLKSTWKTKADGV